MIHDLKGKIIIWDKDGTITPFRYPSDSPINASCILPGVEQTMRESKFNFIVSGYKSPKSESRNLDPEHVIERLKALMQLLPIDAAAFSPYIGGIACFVVIKGIGNIFEIYKAHEDPQYKGYIGKFKKPDIGMFAVIKDIARERFGEKVDGENSLMIGDTSYDEAAAFNFSIPFLHVDKIH